MSATQYTSGGMIGGLRFLRLLAVVPAAGAGVLLATLPVFALPVATLGACYAVLLFWQPLAWLWVLPALTVLLDLTSWTGRPLVNEFDALFLVTFAVALARGEFRGAGGLQLFQLLSAWRAPEADPAPALGIALLGLALLGLFGTPLDSPRVAWLFYFFLFALVLRPRAGGLS
ncbi:hypothetical protein [Chromatocurvus halotolerans]|uniref:Uncharacterized protein n=1 Tax=Chromatocurvus halotolerans TaxID=1132028 RepID=A0A4R2KP18_9GAMM|nr:hypothetical protein [Chromatocurvus halotolerans]TCO74347.1 hypothetical protein EV688_11460 [Chromatocurvus halotolerans]